MKKLSMLLCAFALIGCEEKESAKNIVAERKLDALGNAEFKDDVVTDSQDSRIVGYWAMDVTKALAAYDNLPESYESSAAERSEISQSSLGDGPIYHFKENGEVRVYFGSGVNLATYELHAEEGRDTTVVIETEGEGAESMTLSAKDDSLRMILPEEAPPVAGIFVLSRVPFAKVAKDIVEVEEKAAYWDNLRAERQAERVGFDGHWVPDLEATEATLKRRKPSQQKERPTEEVMRALQEDFQRNPTTVFFDSDNILKIYDKNGEDKMTYGTVEYALGLGNEVHITIDGDWVFTMEDSQLVWNNRYWEITGLAAGVVMKRINEAEAKRRIPKGARTHRENENLVQIITLEVDGKATSVDRSVLGAELDYFYLTSSGAFSIDEIRIGKTYESIISDDSDLIFYEGFEYPIGTRIENQKKWRTDGLPSHISSSSDTYAISTGSLESDGRETKGNMLTADASDEISGIAIRLPAGSAVSQGDDIYISFLIRPDGTLGEGAWGGYFGFGVKFADHKGVLFGKAGESSAPHDKQFVIDQQGGPILKTTDIDLEVGKPSLLVGKLLTQPLRGSGAGSTPPKKQGQ